MAVRAPQMSTWIIRVTCVLFTLGMLASLYHINKTISDERDFLLDDNEKREPRKMVIQLDENGLPLVEGQNVNAQGAWSKFNFVPQKQTEQEVKDDNFLAHPSATDIRSTQPDTNSEQGQATESNITSEQATSDHRLPVAESDVQEVQTAPSNVQRSQQLPTALIVGTRKGGTRALARFLNLHPQIVTLGHEVQFFNNLDNYNKGLEWYRKQMPWINQDQVTIEKTAEYFHTMEVPERVYKMDPKMKIIVVLRDPFDRMVSDYLFLQRFSKQYKTTYHFAEEDHSLEDLVVNQTTGEMMYTHGGLHRSEYHKFVANWLKFFPMDQLLILNGDLLAKENPAKLLRKVEDFLQLRPYLRDSMFYYDSEKGFYCEQEQGCLSDEKGHKHPDYPPWFEKKVRDYFYYKNRLLYDLIGEDFGWR